MTRRKKARLEYFIPIYGTRKLLKRVEFLEMRIDELNQNSSTLVELYESRMQKIYDKLTDLLAAGNLKV
jgi:chaperonin cofactor prefoldin